MENKLIFAKRMKNGYNLYYRNNLAGGRTYISDEIDGTGTLVWDTCLLRPDSFSEAVEFENDLQRKEKT